MHRTWRNLASEYCASSDPVSEPTPFAFVWDYRHTTRDESSWIFASFDWLKLFVILQKEVVLITHEDVAWYIIIWFGHSIIPRSCFNRLRIFWFQRKVSSSSARQVDEKYPSSPGIVSFRILTDFYVTGGAELWKLIIYWQRKFVKIPGFPLYPTAHVLKYIE